MHKFATNVKGSASRYANIGDVIKVAIREAIPTGKVKNNQAGS